MERGCLNGNKKKFKSIVGISWKQHIVTRWGSMMETILLIEEHLSGVVLFLKDHVTKSKSESIHSCIQIIEKKNFTEKIKFFKEMSILIKLIKMFESENLNPKIFNLVSLLNSYMIIDKKNFLIV